MYLQYVCKSSPWAKIILRAKGEQSLRGLLHMACNAHFCIILSRKFAFHITLSRTRKPFQKVTILTFGQRSLFLHEAIVLTLSAERQRTELSLR